MDIGRPSEITSQVYQFGWCLQCTNEHHFFPPRYFHVLSLQLAYKFAQISDKLNRYCTFWKNGLHWFNGHGVGTLVEMVNDSQCVLVLMSSEEEYRENMVSARSDVIRKVVQVYKESCPSLEAEEFLIDSQELDYPMNNPTERTMYRVKTILRCLSERKPLVVNKKGNQQKKISELLSDDTLDCSNISLLGGRDIRVSYYTL